MLTTRQKLFLASIASRLLCRARAFGGKGSTTVVERRGIRWSLDLVEGIDLAIFLYGAFELRTVRAYSALIREGDVVLDVGANVGAHTLPFAQRTGDRGKVIAFEPTAWAFAKLAANLSLNRWAHGRVVLEQVMLTAGGAERVPEKIPASWPLSYAADARHADHGGAFMETAGARSVTLDGYVHGAGISTVDFVKLDVDGNEPRVVRGAIDVLRRDRPTVLIEIAPHGYDGATADFDHMLETFASLDYRLEDVVNRRAQPLDGAALRRAVPAGASRNMFLFGPGRGR